MWVLPAACFLYLSLYFPTPQIIYTTCIFHGPLFWNISSLWECHPHPHFKPSTNEGTFLNQGRLRLSLPLCREAGEIEANTTMPLLSTHVLPLDCWSPFSYHFPLHWQWVSLQQQLLFIFLNILTLSGKERNPVNICRWENK